MRIGSQGVFHNFQWLELFTRQISNDWKFRSRSLGGFRASCFFRRVGFVALRAAGIHTLDQSRVRTAAELLPIKFLQRIHFRRDDVFIHQQRLNIAPPFFVGGAKDCGDIGMRVDDVALFAGISLEVVKL